MNRQLKRMQAKQERLAESQKGNKSAKDRARQQQQTASARRAGVRGFTKEVVQEMRKVLWPTRQQVINSFIVVVIVVIIMTAFVFGLDQGFQRLVEAIYG